MKFIHKKQVSLQEKEINPLQANGIDLSYDEQYKQAILQAIGSEADAAVEYEQILALEDKVGNSELVHRFHDTLVDLRREEIKHLAQLTTKLKETPEMKSAYEAGVEEAENNEEVSVDDDTSEDVEEIEVAQSKDEESDEEDTSEDKESEGKEQEDEEVEKDNEENSDGEDHKEDDDSEEKKESDEEIDDTSAEEEPLQEQTDDTEMYVKCAWCGEELPKSDCKHEKDMGWLCQHCIKGIESREGNLNFDDEKIEENVKPDRDYDSELVIDIIDKNLNLSSEQLDFLEPFFPYPPVDIPPERVDKILALITKKFNVSEDMINRIEDEIILTKSQAQKQVEEYNDNLENDIYELRSALEKINTNDAGQILSDGISQLETLFRQK